ncbi:MAG TPA: PHB depolymerase family esterase [Sphingomicrobium sp.]|nr:PHB depolymerase family esterase [Sphingomicrobium sp.]
MASLGSTVSRLAALRRGAEARPQAASARLTKLDGFGSNPGALGAYCYVPEDLPAGAPLVVVLHGCTQSAAGYDRGSGWSQIADRHGFALLFPEQERANNPNLCFNWFSPADARRGKGEALSIRQMVEAMQTKHGLDPARTFVTGLSAGGAMALVMLATYPDMFAGGAIIAGLPFATANSVPEALERMRGQGAPSKARAAALVANASAHRGPWPTLSVWHGTSDATVDPINADGIVDQWLALHGMAGEGEVTSVDGHRREAWRDASGREVIEKFEIRDMGHGTPLAPSGADACGVAGPYMLDANICSTQHIARYWGIARALPQHEERSEKLPAEGRKSSVKDAPAAAFARGNVGSVIEDALRAAGLMR